MNQFKGNIISVKCSICWRVCYFHCLFAFWRTGSKMSCAVSWPPWWKDGKLQQALEASQFALITRCPELEILTPGDWPYKHCHPLGGNQLMPHVKRELCCIMKTVRAWLNFFLTLQLVSLPIIIFKHHHKSPPIFTSCCSSFGALTQDPSNFSTK